MSMRCRLGIAVILVVGGAGAVPLEGLGGGGETSAIDKEDVQKVSVVVGRLMKARDVEERRPIFRLLVKARVKDMEDIDALLEAARDEDLSSAVLSCLRKIQGPLDENVQWKFVELVDVKDETKEMKILQAVLAVCVKHKIEPTTRIKNLSHTFRAGIGLQDFA